MENQTVAPIDAVARTAGALLRQGAGRLTAAGIAGGARDAEVLLGHALGIGRAELIARFNDAVDARRASAYGELLQRRLEREPVAYIVGRKEFWSLEFRVDPGALIPRPETELLVEICLDLARQATAPYLRIADIAAGSGAIAVAVASELSTASVVATDISPRALALARINAERNQVGDRIQFVVCDLFAGLSEGAMFDVLLSNPPYVRTGEIAELDLDVASWEPREALDGGPDGLDFYRRFAAAARPHLARDGALVLEIGAGMGTAVARIFVQAGGWNQVSIYKDHAGRDRAAVVRPGGSR